MFEDVILCDCMQKAEEEEREYNNIYIKMYRFENRKFEMSGDVQFGEFDMVVQTIYKDEIQYALFEAKCTNSSKREYEESQCQHLDNKKLLEEACSDGRIVFRSVLYNGIPKQYKGKLSQYLGPIQYLNASDFLTKVADKGLIQFFDTEAFARKIQENCEEDNFEESLPPM